MIGIRDIHIQADRPLFRIEEITSFKNSPSTVNVIGVPPNIGKWKITRVYLDVVNPDNNNQVIDCVQFGHVWTGTMPASTSSGRTMNGLVIYADGIDERGNSKAGFVLGKTDIVIYNIDRTIDATTTSDIYNKINNLIQRVEALENEATN